MRLPDGIEGEGIGLHVEKQKAPSFWLGALEIDRVGDLKLRDVSTPEPAANDNHHADNHGASDVEVGRH